MKWYCCIFLALSIQLRAQTFTQWLVWHDQNPIINFDENLALNNDVDIRTYARPIRYHQLLTRSILEYKIPKHKEHKVGVGFGAIFHLLPHNPRESPITLRQEYRPNIDYSFSFSIGSRWKASLRTRTELRWFVEGVHKYYSSTRNRWGMALYYAISEKDLVAFTQEYFHNISNFENVDFFDQNRIELYYSRKFNAKISFKIGYLYWYQTTKGRNQIYHRHILVTRLRYRF